MSDETPSSGNGPLSWRDVYKAVGEAEERILNAISKIHGDLGDHEMRIRSIERDGSTAVRDLRVRVDDHEKRLTPLEDNTLSSSAAGIERTRLIGLTNKGVAAIVLVANFGLGLIIMFANFLRDAAQ